MRAAMRLADSIDCPSPRTAFNPEAPESLQGSIAQPPDLGNRSGPVACRPGDRPNGPSSLDLPVAWTRDFLGFEVAPPPRLFPGGGLDLARCAGGYRSFQLPFFWVITCARSLTAATGDEAKSAQPQLTCWTTPRRGSARLVRWLWRPFAVVSNAHLHL